MRGYLYAVGPWEAVCRGGPWKTRRKTHANTHRPEGSIRLDDEESMISHDARDARDGMSGRSGIRMGKWRQQARTKHQRDRLGLPGFIRELSYGMCDSLMMS